MPLMGYIYLSGRYLRIAMQNFRPTKIDGRCGTIVPAAKIVDGAAEIVDSSKNQNIERRGGHDDDEWPIGRHNDDLNDTTGKATGRNHRVRLGNTA